MTPNDIEELLQQYGADRRQQQQAAEHVRHLAHRQAQRRTALACVAVMAAIVGVVTHRWQQLPEPAGPLVAEQQTAYVPHVTTMPPPIAPDATSAVVATHRPLKVQSLSTQPSDPSDQSEYSDYSDRSNYSDNSDPTTAEPTFPIQSELPPFTPPAPSTPITPS